MTTTIPALALLLSSLLPAADTLPRDLMDTARADGRFTVLLRAVHAAGLEEALRAAGPLTVFAPTDEAFGKLPADTLASLLEPANRDALRRVLAFHVVEGRRLAKDLLPAAPATLAGPPLPLGLRVGEASVVAADIACSNGVVHAIDRVLLPPGEIDAAGLIGAAIDRGVPLFNGGDAAACAAVYARTAGELLARDGALGERHAADLRAALAATAGDDTERAWALRRAFDGILADGEFRPASEAPLPEGFPGPGPVGRIVEKRYPGYRAARAEGGRAFFTLFNHIQKNRVAMTAPVEMTMDEGSGMMDMAFLYERTTQGAAGDDGDVAVLDLPSRRVLSLGMRGIRSTEEFERARALVRTRMEKDGLVADGPFRVLGYNSPMVPPERNFWEVQVPVRDR